MNINHPLLDLRGRQPRLRRDRGDLGAVVVSGKTVAVARLGEQAPLEHGNRSARKAWHSPLASVFERAPSLKGTASARRAFLSQRAAF